MKTIAQEVRETREKIGWTQLELAAYLDLSVRTIQRYEDETSPSTMSRINLEWLLHAVTEM